MEAPQPLLTSPKSPFRPSLYHVLAPDPGESLHRAHLRAGERVSPLQGAQRAADVTPELSPHGRWNHHFPAIGWPCPCLLTPASLCTPLHSAKTPPAVIHLGGEGYKLHTEQKGVAPSLPGKPPAVWWGLRAGEGAIVVA